MKGNVIYLVFACVLAAACDPVGWDYPLNRMRSQVLAPGRIVRDTTDSSAPAPPPVFDTSVLIAGVRMPQSYNWQRDTGIGLAEGEVVLLRDLQEVLSFPTGYEHHAGTDPDTHHLIEGHLYTEFSTLSHTFIKKDGRDAVSFEGREYLAGLVEKDGDIYTLGARRSGAGFCLRRNGDILLSSNTGSVIGSFSDSSFPASGALYEDAGGIVFAYNSRTGSGQRTHLVRDGKDTTVDGGPYDDARYVDGVPICLRVSTNIGLQLHDGNGTRLTGASFEWFDCSLFNATGRTFAVGRARERSSGKSGFICLALDTGEAEVHPDGDYHLYADGDRVGFAPASYPGYFYFSRNCMEYFDGCLYLVLSREGVCPVLIRDGTYTEIPMSGFLSGVQVWVSPPS